MWRREAEDWAAMTAGAQNASQFMVNDFDPAKLGASLGVCERLKVENQGNENSCAGHAITTVCESDILLASDFTVDLQLSRAFAYAEGQRKCGLIGADQGCAISGVVQAANEVGICLESSAPYTGNYYTRFTQAAYTEAKTHTLKSYIPITSLEQIYLFLAQRNGGAILGINWNNACRSLVNNCIVNWRDQGTAGGLHAVPIVDWCDKRRDKRNWPFLKLPNSWDKSYGDNGVAYVEPASLEAMIKSSMFAGYLVSGMSFIRPRVDWNTVRFFK